MEEERLDDLQQTAEEPYRPRPKRQLVLAWVLIAVVLFAFFGTCYWMMNYGAG